MKLQLRIFGIITGLLLSFTAVAQEIEVAARLRLAQSFEQSGDWERAVIIYEDLHKRDPANYVFFDGLRRSYAQVKRYDEAVALVQQRLAMQPKDPLLTSMLAGLYYDAGEEKKADSLWQTVLASDRKNQGLYRLVAAQMLEHRLFDLAIRTYVAGRSAGLGQDIFAEELASIYSARQQYGAATKEFIRILKKSPDQLPYIENRISAFTMRADALRAAGAAVQEEIQVTPNNVTLRLLLAWLAMEGKDFESAFIQYHVVDSLRKAKGVELFSFAQRATQEKAYRVSARAFREIIEHQGPVTILPQARFGYARAIEELSAETDTMTENIPTEIASWPVSESQPSSKGAIALYGRIVAEYPQSDLAAQSHYRIGLIRFNRLFDLDGALSAFDAAAKAAKSQNLQSDATLKVGEVFLAQNNLMLARKDYARLTTSGMPSFRDRAVFALAEIDYFEGMLDSSLTKLGRLTSNVNLDLANDALQLQYFIQENKTSAAKALQDFAKADLLDRQRKYSEALTRFKEIVRVYPNALLIDDATMKIGELQVVLRQPNDALSTFQKVAEIQTSILRDRAQFRIGEIYQNIVKDKTKAIEAYELLLVKYSNSMYAEEARKRIRQLRGDSI